MIRTLGALIGADEKARQLAAALAARVEQSRARAAEYRERPRVYFEEWDEPMISGIGWVSELVEAAGGIDVFKDLSTQKSAKDRIVSAERVIEAAPDIVVGSWCGKKFVPAKFATRPGFDAVPAVRSGFLREIKSPLILQPGPAALTDGLVALERIVADWRGAQGLDASRSTASAR
jgi:iron complex transport system substrate-binding protein